MNTTVPDVQKLTALFIETFLSFQPDFERENRVANAGRPHRQGPHQEAPRPGQGQETWKPQERRW